MTDYNKEDTIGGKCRSPVAVPGVRLAHGGAALLLPPVWGARYLPCRRCGCVSYRPRHTLMLRFICHWQRGATWPRPLARVAPPATGGAPLAPQIFTGDLILTNYLGSRFALRVLS